MTIRVTITKSNVFDQYGNPLPIGTVYTPPQDAYAFSLIRSLQAIDTDAVLNRTDNERFSADSKIGIEPFSRNLSNSDFGRTLECLNAGLTFTIPAGLNPNFWCNVIPNGTTSIAAAGTTLLNGAQTTITRAATANPMFQVIPRATITNNYVVTGS